MEATSVVVGFAALAALAGGALLVAAPMKGTAPKQADATGGPLASFLGQARQRAEALPRPTPAQLAEVAAAGGTAFGVGAGLGSLAGGVGGTVIGGIIGGSAGGVGAVVGGPLGGLAGSVGGTVLGGGVAAGAAVSLTIARQMMGAA